MEIKEQIAVMQAFAEGKEIEVSPTGRNDWGSALTPVWNWSSFVYRIKTEPKLRPYTFEELANALIEKGKGYVKQKGELGIFIIIRVSSDDVKLSYVKYCSFEQLLENYQWLDGSPCGVIEEE